MAYFIDSLPPMIQVCTDACNSIGPVSVFKAYQPISRRYSRIDTARAVDSFWINQHHESPLTIRQRLKAHPIPGSPTIEAHVQSNGTLTRTEILLLVSAVTLMAVTVWGTALFR